MKLHRATFIFGLALTVFAVGCGSDEPTTLTPVSTLSDAGTSSGANADQSASPTGVTIAADTPISSTTAPVQTSTSVSPTSATDTVTITRPPTTEPATESATEPPELDQQAAVGSGGAAPTPAEVEAEVSALLAQMLGAWTTCASDPQQCNPSTRLGVVYGGELLEVASAEISQRAAIGRRTLPPIDPADNRIQLLGIRMESIDSDTAIISYCHIDGSILVESRPDGTDLILDDSVASIAREALLERNANGQWRMLSRSSTKLFENNLGCSQ